MEGSADANMRATYYCWNPTSQFKKIFLDYVFFMLDIWGKVQVWTWTSRLKARIHTGFTHCSFVFCRPACLFHQETVKEARSKIHSGKRGDRWARPVTWFPCREKSLARAQSGEGRGDSRGDRWSRCPRKGEPRPAGAAEGAGGPHGRGPHPRSVQRGASSASRLIRSWGLWNWSAGLWENS